MFFAGITRPASFDRPWYRSGSPQVPDLVMKTDQTGLAFLQAHSDVAKVKVARKLKRGVKLELWLVDSFEEAADTPWT